MEFAHRESSGQRTFRGPYDAKLWEGDTSGVAAAKRCCVRRTTSDASPGNPAAAMTGDRDAAAGYYCSSPKPPHNLTSNNSRIHFLKERRRDQEEPEDGMKGREGDSDGCNHQISSCQFRRHCQSGVLVLALMMNGPGHHAACTTDYHSYGVVGVGAGRGWAEKSTATNPRGLPVGTQPRCDNQREAADLGPHITSAHVPKYHAAQAQTPGRGLAGSKPG